MVCGAQITVRPMVVGERVSVTSSSQTITGIVERIDFLRTVIRTDAYKPYWLPNKARALGLFLVH
jgi:small-conductance mechanosensitive channel